MDRQAWLPVVLQRSFGSCMMSVLVGKVGKRRLEWFYGSTWRSIISLHKLKPICQRDTALALALALPWKTP